MVAALVLALVQVTSPSGASVGVCASAMSAESAPSAREMSLNLAYFSKSLWPCEHNRQFYGDWYGKHLRAMEEPSFAAADAARGYSRRYRLLVLPTFTPAYAIRIDVPLHGPVRATVVTETGAGGYDPGNKVPLWSYEIREHHPGEMDDMVRGARIENRTNGAEPETPSGQIVVCGDGTRYVFEELDADGTQHLVSRHQCDLDGDRPMIDLFYHMHRIGRLTVPYELMSVIAGPPGG